MNRTIRTFALAGTVLIATPACTASSSSSSTSSATTSSATSSVATPSAGSSSSASSSPLAARAAGGHTDSSLAQVLTASGALPAAGIAPATAMANDRNQQASEMQTFKKLTFFPAACGEDFLAYMDGIGGAGARAKATSATPRVMVVLAAQPDATAAQQVVARFTSLAASCARMTMSYQGQSQAVNFTKAAPKAVGGADQVALGGLSQSSGGAVQQRRIELARVGNVIIQVTTQPDGAASAEKVMAAVVKAVVAHPVK